MAEDVLLPGLQDYLANLFPDRDEVLLEMEAYAEERQFPIVGPLIGTFLMQYARLIGAKRILELGSGFGYSAIWFAKGSTENAEIICTDFSGENVEKAKSYFERAGVSKKIQFRVGDGLEILDQLGGDFDIIFNDIEKEDYPSVLKAAVPRLRKGGLLITDNVLWSGRILDSSSTDKTTMGINEYNRLAFNDSRILSSLVPIRDGLGISLKL
ncbi:MAG: O-methyltransferase [Candidatus Heimdallarchaeota archaeon]